MLKDQLREFEKNILNGLSDIGINPDEPPVRQSERSEAISTWLLRKS